MLTGVFDKLDMDFYKGHAVAKINRMSHDYIIFLAKYLMANEKPFLKMLSRDKVREDDNILAAHVVLNFEAMFHLDEEEGVWYPFMLTD